MPTKFAGSTSLKPIKVEAPPPPPASAKTNAVPPAFNAKNLFSLPAQFVGTPPKPVKCIPVKTILWVGKSPWTCRNFLSPKDSVSTSFNPVKYT